jgi:hypothetical protein
MHRVLLSIRMKRKGFDSLNFVHEYVSKTSGDAPLLRPNE